MKPGPKTQPDVIMEPDLPGELPDPPGELSEDEAKEWRRYWLVSPPGWFPKETWPLLVQLCRHIVNARWLGETMQEIRVGLLDPRNAEDIKHLEVVTRLHDREGRAMSAIMERLRLTTQQRMKQNVAVPMQAEQAPEVRPWITQ